MAANLNLTITAIDKISGTLGHIEGKAGGLGNTFNKLGKTAAVGAGAGIVALGGFLASSVKEAMEAQKVQAQLAAALKSTGGAAGLSEKQILDMAAGLQRVTAYGDEAIVGAQNLLLTFTNIKGDQFKGATTAVLDMATAMGTDLNTAAIQVGKALNDPIRGATALRRAGVQLSEQQEEQIKKMVEMGDVASAQKVIMGELTTQFGGSAAAAANTFGGRMAQLKNSFGEIQESIGMALLPLLQRLATGLSKFLTDHQADIERLVASFNEWATVAMPKIEAFVNSEIIPMLVDAFAQLRQTIEGLMPVVKEVVTFLEENKVIAIGLGVALLALVAAFAGPMLAIPALIAIGVLLLAHWDEIRNKVTQLVADFKEKFPAMYQVVETVFELIKNRIMFYVDLVRNIIAIATALWHGDFGAAWEGIKALFSDSLGHILTEIKGTLNLMLIAAKELMPLIKDTITGALQGALDFVIGLGSQAVNAGRGFINALAGGIRDAINNALIGTVESGINAMLRGLAKGLQSAKNIADAIPGPNPFGDSMQSAIDALNAGVSIPRLQQGAMNIPENMLAFLHKGEMVVPSRFADLLRNIISRMQQGRATSADALKLMQAGLHSPAQAVMQFLQGQRSLSDTTGFFRGVISGEQRPRAAFSFNGATINVYANDPETFFQELRRYAPE